MSEKKCSCGKQIFGLIGVALIPSETLPVDMKYKFACQDCMTDAFRDKPKERFFLVFYKGFFEKELIENCLAIRCEGFVRKWFIMDVLEKEYITNVLVTNILEIKEQDFLDYSEEKINLESSKN